MNGNAEAPDVAEMLTVLRHAVRVSLGPMGFAQVELPEFVAYKWARLQGDTLRPHLEELLRNGDRGGRIYAAMLLHDLDAGAGANAWRSLLDVSDVVLMSPERSCSWVPMPIREFAADVLRDGNYNDTMGSLFRRWQEQMSDS